jgi:hypothetical protein
MMLLALTSIIACSLAARGFQLQSRSIQSQATCSSDFSWADNSANESPCMVAAYVNAPCYQNNFNVAPLNGSHVYTPPSSASGTLQPCTCSWAAYNLISACTDCQGFSNVTTSWSAYSFNCGALLTKDTYYPNITLANGTLIPFWATTDPTTWTGAQFDVTMAKSISAEGHADVGSPASPTTTTTTTTKSKPIGAIVGGVVGGVTVLLAAIILGLYLFRRNSRAKNATDPSPLLMNHTHLRSHSEVTANSNNNLSTPNMSSPAGYTSLSSSPFRRSTPTIHTHESYAPTTGRSLSFFRSGGGSTIAPSMRPSMRQQSPPPVSIQRDETAVEPFRLAPTNNYDPDRKQANGAYPVYDQPTAPPAIRTDVRSTTPTQGGRTRYNPPAYTDPTNASPEAGGSSRRSPPTVGQAHGKKSSADTQHSITSGGSAPRVTGGNQARGNNNVVNHVTPPPGTVKNTQMNNYSSQANTSLDVITGHGRQFSGDTNSDMDRKRRPDTDDFSVRDIA